MILKAKYQPVLDLAKELHADQVEINEEGGFLNMKATLKTPYLRNRIWDKIKEIGGDDYSSEVKADIRTETDDYYHLHTVESGETLGAISEKYYGTPGRYQDIFEMNNDQLEDPDKIEVGQTLKIPPK